MKLLNRYEEITYDKLKSVAAENDAHVFAKVRVADVLPLSGSSISRELFDYGLRAHFDFTVTTSTYKPMFVVEFDGPIHRQSKIQQQRDERKNSIARHFRLPLLRINSRYVDRAYRGLDLLTYFTEVWFLTEAFDKAQSEGAVPHDEPFDPNLIVFDGRSQKKFPYWLSLDIQLEIQKFKKAGLIEGSVVSDWIGVDEAENWRCLAWLHVENDRVLLARTGMRHQLFPADVSDILGQISVFDIRRDLDAYLKDRTKAVSLARLETLLEEHKKRYRMCSFSVSSKYR